jgi:hypothetical protein
MNSFEGLDVTESAVAIADGPKVINEALAATPKEWQIGERVVIILDTVVTAVNHAEIPDVNELRRVHALRAHIGTATQDVKSLERILDAQRKAIDAAKGQPQLEPDDDGEAA